MDKSRIQLSADSLKDTTKALCCGLWGNIRLIGGALLIGGRGGFLSTGVPSLSCKTSYKKIQQDSK